MTWAPKKQVVVPIDFSSASDDAIQTALEIAQRLADVQVTHVAQVPDVVPYGGEVFATVDPERWRQLAITHLGDYLKARAQFEGVSSIVIDGDSGTGIAEYATKCHADLIGMPSHGYHGVKRFLLGSVTEIRSAAFAL